jgi:hypothetical protein
LHLTLKPGEEVLMFEYFRRKPNGMSILAAQVPANPLIPAILRPRYPREEKNIRAKRP